MTSTIPESHCFYKSIPEVYKITQSIADCPEYIKFGGYFRQYDNGKCFDLSVDADWAKNFYEKYLFHSQYITDRLKPGIHHWSKNKAETIKNLSEYAKYNFNIDARIEFIYRDDINQCYNLYAFASDRKNAKKAYRFYDIHRNKLFKFIAYFNKEAAHLMAESNKPENLIQIPGYNIDDIDDPIRDYMREILEENQETELSSREFETMLLYAYGLKTAQIAEVFSKSPKAVETQLLGIRRKTGCQDRKSLQLYVRKNGWNGLERFFFKSKGVPTLSKSIH